MRQRIQIASQENCCLRSGMRNTDLCCGRNGCFLFFGQRCKGRLPFYRQPKIEKTAFVAHCATRSPRTRSLVPGGLSVRAEQGNRVQFPDMCRIWTIRLSSCDCGASLRPRVRADFERRSLELL